MNATQDISAAGPLSAPLAAPRNASRRRQLYRIGAVVTAAAVLGALVVAEHGHSDKGVSGALSPTAMAQGSAWNSTSDNWSGYAATTAQTGQRYTAASATWVVPQVAPMDSASAGVGCAAMWTGIGGATSKDLIQLGTDSCANSSETGYYAWFEVLPAAGTPVQVLNVEPGDTVDASLRLAGNPTSSTAMQSSVAYTEIRAILSKYDSSLVSGNVIEKLRQLLVDAQSKLRSEPWWPAIRTYLQELFSTPAPAATQTWDLSFRITSPGGTVQTWSKVVQYASSFSSVEWITEAPTAAAGVESLPDYGVARFLSVTVNGSTPALSPNDEILLGDPHGEASVPSMVTGSHDAFNTCYFPTHQVQACAAP